MNELILDIILAFIGGVLGASLGALGGFVIFGLLGVIGYLYLIFGLSEIWLESLFSVELFVPSVCFIGGAVATAYARKRKFIECGKDIGRSLISLRNFSVILVGGTAGVIGFLLLLLLSPLRDRVDTIAMTVVIIPLIIKYLWGLTKTNDCEGSSHVLPSPYRFFEQLSRAKGKVWLTLTTSLLTALVTLALYSDEHTRLYAGTFMFFLSALSLYLLFFSVPIPATHHICGPAGIIVVKWCGVNGFSFTAAGVVLPIFWAVTIALISQLGCDITKRFLFDEGDIHVDPPAGGIILGSLIAMWLFPALGLYGQSAGVQVAVAVSLSVFVLFVAGKDE